VERVAQRVAWSEWHSEWCGASGTGCRSSQPQRIPVETVGNN